MDNRRLVPLLLQTMNRFELKPRIRRRAAALYRWAERYHRYQAFGLDALPPGPFILAVNHSLATYDIGLLVYRIYVEHGRMMRGLGDRLIFRLPGIDRMFTDVGVVEARPENAAALLAAGEGVLVAPGGMAEALRTSRQKYQLMWEERRGFVRLSIRTGVPIVLAACPRADDLFHVFDSKVTDEVYERFRVPVPVGRGLGPSPVPRPIRLWHYLSEPIPPPPFDEDRFDDDTAAHHARIVGRMQDLMVDALVGARVKDG